jgi:tRNA modification GTPase
MNLLINDIITAVATPIGEGAISVIRVSGENSFRTVDSIFKGKTKISFAASHTIHYGKIIDEKGVVIDDVLVSVFRGPNSYTGEDSVEISTHGNSIITKRILELLLSKNVRSAEPGEFTKRAFLNGKIDLSQAEAVLDLIKSRTDSALRGARNQLDGLLSQKVHVLRQSLLNASSLIELELDFSEEGYEFMPKDEIIEKIDKVLNEIDYLLDSYRFGKVLRDGINLAIIGEPNVGKSSLLNYILKEARAIVSDIPGTTRDIIREEISIDGVLFKIFDTAGIRKSEDEIEIEGVKRSLEAVKNADVILWLTDVNNYYSETIKNELNKFTNPKKIIKVVNKIDLGQNNDIEADVYISSKTGEGISTLFDEMKKHAVGEGVYTEKSTVINNVRHYNALKRTVEYLDSAKNSIYQEMSGEFIAVDLRNAIDSLSEIIGIVTTDDILNNIFDKFCIGK